MEIESYTDHSYWDKETETYYEEDYLGEVHIKCDCRHKFIEECGVADYEVECPKCKRTGIIKGTGYGGVWIIDKEERK